MNSSSKENSETCFFCKKRPVTTKYTDRLGKRTELVCAQCLDRLEVQDAMEWGMIEIRKATEQERYDKILAWIDAFDAANRHRDHDGWMARSVASSRAHYLWEAERYEEALIACDVVEQLGFEDAWYRFAARGARANVLQGLGRHDEALATFEDALRHHDLGYMEGTRHLMNSLAEFSANAGKPVDESWREVVQNVANEYDVEMPVRETLGETILALFELTENKPSKRQREG